MKVILSNQRPLLHSIIQSAFENIPSSLLFEHLFPDTTVVRAMVMKAVFDAAHNHIAPGGRYNSLASFVHQCLLLHDNYWAKICRLVCIITSSLMLLIKLPATGTYCQYSIWSEGALCYDHSSRVLIHWVTSQHYRYCTSTALQLQIHMPSGHSGKYIYCNRCDTNFQSAQCSWGHKWRFQAYQALLKWPNPHCYLQSIFCWRGIVMCSSFWLEVPDIWTVCWCVGCLKPWLGWWPQWCVSLVNSGIILTRNFSYMPLSMSGIWVFISPQSFLLMPILTFMMGTSVP